MKSKSGKRLREIIKVFTKYGVGRVFNKNDSDKSASPKALREAFEELGATFIKIGQILSTRPDLLPDIYIRELVKLQDNNSYTDFITVKKMFSSEFGSKLEDNFLYFNERPFASASIAQAHKAILKDGTEVVVKVQYPDIEEKMKLDLMLLKKILNHTKGSIGVSIVDPIEILNEIESATLKEFDFLLEVDNMIRFKELNNETRCIKSPRVISGLCSKKIITMEFIDGFKITNTEKLEDEGYDRSDVGRKLSLSFCKQIFNDGFFHGDPHPGNLLISDNKIAFIDFGIVGELTPNIKKKLNKAIISIGTKDINGSVEFILSVGKIKGKINENELYNDFDTILNKYSDISMCDIKISQLLKEITEITNRHNIQLPKELTSLIRAMIILEGVVAQIAPDLEIMDTIILFMKEQNKKKILSEFDMDDFTLKGYKFSVDGFKMPTKFIELVNYITKGRIKLHVEIIDEKFIIRNLNKMINRIAFAVVVGCMIVGSSLVLNSNVGPKLGETSIIGISGYTISAVFGIWLMISIIKSGFF